MDLYDTDNIELLDEFLFWILIGKLYKVKEDIFYLLKDIEIYVEIPNGFIDFYTKFPILTLIPEKFKNFLSIYNLENLIVSNNIDSNEQIVCNYLKLLKNNCVNDIDLYFPNITQENLRKYAIKEKTNLNAEIINQEECQELIFKNIKNISKNKLLSYYQIKSFIDILAVQLKKLNQSYILNAAKLKYGMYNLKKVRAFAINIFINQSSYFIDGAFSKLINSQNMLDNNIFNDYLDSDNHCKISYDTMKSSLILFHEGNKQSFSIITNKKQMDKEFFLLLELNSCQRKGNEKYNNHLIDYKSKTFQQKDFIRELKEILNINNPLRDDLTNLNNKDLKFLEDIANDYVFTADNFVKIILILIRLRANIPIIMMGETGCGKTALIRKLVELKNNGFHERLKILNIHARINDKDIINFINNEVNPAAEKLEKSEKIIKMEKEINKQFYDEKKIWVFLDEINTCKSMGLISELICKHSCQGKKLRENIIFISACNPYRKAKLKKESFRIINQNAKINMKKMREKQKIIFKKKSFKSQLIYNVNPLPNSLLNFIFDFGHLEKEDEEKYIEKIIEPSVEKIFKESKEDLEEEKLVIIKKISKDMIIEAQNFIRNNHDISSVSLREIKRYTIFYEFFYKYLKNKKENLIDLINNPKEKNIFIKFRDFDFQIYAVNLAIFICYYLRLTNKELREQLAEKLDKILQNVYKDKKFTELPEIEENFIVNNIILPPGIAKNKPLLENIFSLFCAILTKIPIFIIGKPGSSKSLSVHLISKAMKGNLSKNKLFYSLPKLIVFPYQASLISSSEGITEIFQRAHKISEKFQKENNESIALIFFDEIGLAEHSPNNPLKVILSELENDLNADNKKIAFVGISNWVLDASKMNRGIHISIPDLDEDDDIITAKAIAKSYNIDLDSKIFKEFFEMLGKTYYNYKMYLNKNQSYNGIEDFHGNRDFFHFVKYASSKLKEKNYILKENDLYLIGLKSIERNFAGFIFENEDQDKSNSVDLVKKIYNGLYKNMNINNSYDYIKNIRENKSEENSRYLLLISKSSESYNLLTNILEGEKLYYLIGSQFKDDLNNEEYQLKVLEKIQIFMQQGKTLILKDLESIYPALYDLFNQNYISMNGKNFTSISIGSAFNKYSIVNDKFKCIINIDFKKIESQEISFLNRFEKHIITYENLLNKNLKYISNNIKIIFDNILSNIEGTY